MSLRLRDHGERDVDQAVVPPTGAGTQELERDVDVDVAHLRQRPLACSIVMRLLRATWGLSVSRSPWWMARCCRSPMVAMSARAWMMRTSSGSSMTMSIP